MSYHWTGWDLDLAWNTVLDYYDPEHTNRDYKKKWTDSDTYEDPKKFDELYDDIFGGTVFKPFLDWYKNKMIRNDAEKMDDDEKKNSGQTWENSLYKWWSYYNSSRSGHYSGAGSPGELFEASESVINAFDRRLFKW